MREKIEKIFSELDRERKSIADGVNYIFERGAVEGRLTDELLKILPCGHVLALVDVKANRKTVDKLIETLSNAKYKITIKYCLAESMSARIVICDETSDEINNIAESLPDDVRMTVAFGGADLLTYCQYRLGERDMKIVFVMSESVGDTFDGHKSIVEDKRIVKFTAKVPNLTVIDSDFICANSKNAPMYALALCSIGGYYLVECAYMRAKKGGYNLRFLTALEEEYISVMKGLSSLTKREAGEKLLGLLTMLTLARRATDSAELNVGARLLSAVTAQCEELEQENFATLLCIVMKNYYLRLNKICGLYFPTNRTVNQNTLRKSLELSSVDFAFSKKSVDFDYENFVMMSEAREILKRLVTLDKINPTNNLKALSIDKGYSLKKVIAVKYLSYIKAGLELIEDGTLLKNLYVKGII